MYTVKKFKHTFLINFKGVYLPLMRMDTPFIGQAWILRKIILLVKSTNLDITLTA